MRKIVNLCNMCLQKRYDTNVLHWINDAIFTSHNFPNKHAKLFACASSNYRFCSLSHKRRKHNHHRDTRMCTHTKHDSFISYTYISIYYTQYELSAPTNSTKALRVVGVYSFVKGWQRYRCSTYVIHKHIRYFEQVIVPRNGYTHLKIYSIRRAHFCMAHKNILSSWVHIVW